MTLQKEIWTRRERNGRTSLWVREDVLIDMGCSVSTGYLRTKARPGYTSSVQKHRRNQSILPDKKVSWRFAKVNGQFYYDYDRLPAARKKELPSKEEIMRRYDSAEVKSRIGKVEEFVKKSLNDWKQFADNYTEYDFERRVLLSQAASLLTACVELVKEGTVNINKLQFFKDMEIVLKDIGVKYMPSNHRRLQQKVRAVLDGALVEVEIDLPRKGNANALRYGDDELMSWVAQMRSSNANYSNAHIIRKLRQVAALSDKSIPSVSWFKKELAKPESKWKTTGRFGSMGLGVNQEATLSFSNAVYAGDCWQMDGTRVNLIPHKGESGKDEFLYILSVVDVHSKDILGVHLDTKEDRIGWITALKNAVNNCNYLPHEIVHDKFPGHNTDEWKAIAQKLEAQGTKLTVSSRATYKAVMERFFGTFQSVFLMDTKEYYGEGIKSGRVAAHRSPEYLKAQMKESRRNGWSFEDAVKVTKRAIADYRNTPFSEYSRRYKDVTKSPAEMRMESDAPNAKKIELHEFVDMFGFEKRLKVRKRGQLVTEICKAKLAYGMSVELWSEVKKHKYVTLCYDLDDLSVAYLFEDSSSPYRQFFGVAEEMKKINMYGPDKDLAEMARQQAMMKAVKDADQRELEETISKGSDITHLLGRHASKGDTSSAEDQYFRSIVNDDESPELVSVDPVPVDDEDFEVNTKSHARNNY